LDPFLREGFLGSFFTGQNASQRALLAHESSAKFLIDRVLEKNPIP
jgi:hypothetical protein